MRPTNEMLIDLVRSLSELSLLAGWSAEELQDSLRKALADAGPVLGLSRDATAERLRVSRRVLSTWANRSIGNHRRRSLDLVRELWLRRGDNEVPPDDTVPLKESFDSLFDAGLVGQDLSLPKAVEELLVANVERVRKVIMEFAGAEAPENARAQP